MYNKNIIFICGCGHSGTTILNKIIGNHKNIYSISKETGFFARHKEKDKDEDIIKNLGTLDKRIELNKKWLCEKTPGHIYGIDRIFKLIENPKIIVIIRDGRDVVASLHKRYDDFDKSVNRWIEDNIAWSNNSHKDSFHLLRYEDLIKEPQIQLAKICDYLEEEYDNNMLNYEREKRERPIFDGQIEGDDHAALRDYQLNQDLYDGTKRYLRDLTESQMHLLYSNEKFMELMKKFDYFD
jgi:hypothetical protein